MRRKNFDQARNEQAITAPQRGAMYRPIADPNCPVCCGTKWVHHLTPVGQAKFDAGQFCDMTTRENVDFSKAYICKCCKPTPRDFEVEER